MGVSSTFTNRILPSSGTLDKHGRKAEYQRRLHPISLFVFRVDGLPWPASSGERIGGVEAYRQTVRGFTVILWRAGDLGYALVSDVDSKELADLPSKLAD